MLEIKNVSKAYKINNSESFYALRSVSLKFEKNGLVSIVGRSGCGKTTLLNLIANLDKPSIGKIELFGKNLNKKNAPDRNIGIVFQNYNLLEEYSALYNVMLPLLIAGVKRKKAIEQSKAILGYLGFNGDSFDKKCYLLSGGEKQRIAIARCLVYNPSIVICDEPTGALDLGNSLKVMNILKKLSKDRLVLIVSHNLQLCKRYSDRIIEMESGCIVGDKEINKNTEKIKNKKLAFKRSTAWTDRIAFSNAKKRFARNLFSTIGFVVGLTSLLGTIGFINGKDLYTLNDSKNQVNYSSGTLSKEEQINSSGLIKLTRSIRPSINDIYTNKIIGENFNIYLNYDAIFTSFLEIKYEDIFLNECLLTPVESFDNLHVNYTLLYRGYFPSNNVINEIMINKKTYDYINKMIGKDCLYEKINIKQLFTMKYVDFDNTEIIDDFIFEEYFKIVGVLNEIDYLSTNKIFYSYSLLDAYMGEEICDNLSTYFNKETTWKDVVSDCDDSSPISSYSYYLFPKNINNTVAINSLANNLVFTSPTLLVRDSLINFTSAAELGFDVFLLISTIGVILILGIITFANYSDDHKISAIFTCLGATKSNICNIYFFESSMFCFLGILFSIPLSLGLQKLGNNVISNTFGIHNLINIPFSEFAGIKYCLPLVIVALSILLCYFSTIIPISFSKSKPIREELGTL